MKMGKCFLPIPATIIITFLASFVRVLAVCDILEVSIMPYQLKPRTLQQTYYATYLASTPFRLIVVMPNL